MAIISMRQPAKPAKPDCQSAVTRAAVLALLGDAYRARDLVALMDFREMGASLLIKQTGDVVLALARLQSLPTGGRTPWAPRRSKPQQSRAASALAWRRRKPAWCGSRMVAPVRRTFCAVFSPDLRLRLHCRGRN
jgi:hypothetical protein